MKRLENAQLPGPTDRERAAQEAVTRLLRTVDALHRSLERTFARFGVTGQQYNVLRILRGAGEPLPTMAVAERMMEKTPGLTGILDRLEGKSLVRRERSPDDRRVWLCSLTEEGRSLLREMEGPVRKANVDAVRAAGVSDLRSLVAVLDRIEEPRS